MIRRINDKELWNRLNPFPIILSRRGNLLKCMPLCYHPLREVDDSRYDTTLVKLEDQNSVKFFLWFIASHFAHSPGWPHRLSSSESCTMRSSSSLPLSTHFLCNQESSQDLLRIRIHWTESLLALKEVVPGTTTLNRYLNSWSREPFSRDNPLVESGRKTRVFKDYTAAVLSFVPSPLNQL